MRSFVAVLGVVVLVVLGTIQTIAAVALRAQAADASLARVTPSFVVAAIDELEPQTFWPLPLRRVLGADALERGDLRLADRFERSLPSGPDRDALAGAISLARGDTSAAVAAYMSAGDLADLERDIDRLVDAGRVDAALTLQRRLIARLEALHAQHDTLAQAWYRLGLLEQDRAFGLAPQAGARLAAEMSSRAAYQTAVDLAPIEARYLIALGNQDLNVNDLASARATFGHLHDLNPGNVEAFTGLADAAIRAGDPITARSYLARATAIAPGDPAIANVAAKLQR